jgi:hypothetical protein
LRVVPQDIADGLKDELILDCLIAAEIFVLGDDGFDKEGCFCSLHAIAAKLLLMDE